jgi:hypothetical protein
MNAWNDTASVSKVTGEGGMTDKTSLNMKMPCKNCLVTYFHAGFEYANGSIANANTGAWMHHLDIFNMGVGKVDLKCGAPKGYELIYADGNERKPIDFGKAKAGYYVGPNDRFFMVSEIMNMASYEQETYITITYEYLEGKPAGFSNAKLLWMDVVGCNKPTSEINPTNSHSFAMNTIPWTSTLNGPMLSFAGHEHDGGTKVELYVNDKLICDSAASYGNSSNPAYVSTNMMGESMTMEHISGMTQCYQMGSIKETDTAYIKAYYDFVAHPGLKTVTGKLDQVMGIGGLYIGVPLT